MIRVRVRGIYATAITKLLLDNGLNVSHASKVIRERFGIDESDEPSTVTIKDTDQKHGIVIVGEYEHGRRVFDILKEKAVTHWVSKLPLHAIIKGKVVDVREGKSIIDLGDYKGILDQELEVGSVIFVDVARPFMPHEDFAKLSTKYTIFGNYVALIKGLEQKVVFSRHITDRKLRDDLITLSAVSNVEDWCIKWRSSAIIGSLDEMLQDIRDTYKKAVEVMKQGEKANIGDVIYNGEFFAILSLNKEYFDEIRNKVIPTMRYHHSLKSVGENEVVDFSEHLLQQGFDRDGISESAREYVISKMGKQRLISIEHVSALKCQILRLTPGKPIGYCQLKRVFEKPGIFDGLNIRKEPGDYDIMEFSPGLPVILHKYYGRDGSFKGLYVNLNTPPDIGRNLIRYIDMEVDVVSASGEAKIIDVEKLKKACDLGIITENVKDYYFNLAERIKEFLESHDVLDVTLDEVVKYVNYPSKGAS